MEPLVPPRVPLEERSAEDALPEIKLVVLEFEGVLSDGRVWTDAQGGLSAATWRGDELALTELMAAGRDVVIIARDTLPAARAVAERLGAQFRVHQVDNKGQAFKMCIFDHQLAPGQVAYVGAAMDDLPPMAVAGMPVAVGQAPEWVTGAARLVLSQPGGRGAMAELTAMLLKDYLPGEG